MNFVGRQTSFTRLTPKVACIPATVRVETKRQRVAKPPTKKPELFGRFSEVTILAIFMAMLAPLGAIAYAAGMPGICMVAGAISGFFGAVVYLMEKWAAARS
jgi:membrane associated rhomboid family serine protease